jgi:F420-non-reducing hydrogenase iron-sulfur subunit
VAILKEVLKTVGLDEDRVWLRWISASEGRLFADTITEMVRHLKDMGPNQAAQIWSV